MAKKPTITSITSGYASTNTLNDNFEALRDAFDNTLSLDGSTPNSMTSDLNLNNNDILNASRILVGGVDYIATALSYKNDAETAKTAAEAAQAAAELAYDNFDDRYLGSKASDPTVDNDGNALLDGALYYDTINTVMKFYDTSTSTWYRTTPNTSDQANIDIVAGNTTNINTVAGISANVTTVAGISSDVTTVAADTTDIGTVATSISNVNTAATNISNINTVAGISANVTTVAGNTSNINTVATDISNVNTVAGQTTNLQNVTDNLTAIQNAATNATNAATSASNAATSASNAATSASNASTSETNAASSATSAAASAAAAAASADFFDDVYLGSKASDPATDNDGDALNAGDLYFNTTSNNLKVYSGSAWQDAAVDSSGFVQTTGDTLTGNLNFGDNDKAIFGAGPDLQIYHTGTASYIQEYGTGDLFIAADTNVNITNTAATETKAVFTSNGSVDLYYDNSKKLATTATGIDVTGTVTADGLTVDGDAGIKTTPYGWGSNYASLDVGNGGSFSSYNAGGFPAAFITSNAYNNNTNWIANVNDQSCLLVLEGTTGSIKFSSSTSNTAAGSPVTFVEHMRIASNGDISFYEDTGTTAKFFWDASAESLGIGTSSPSQTLHVYHPTNNELIRVESGDVNANIIFEDSTTTVPPFIGATGDDFRFITNFTERMRITSAGNVGIGTTSPQSKLHLNGTGATDAKIELQSGTGVASLDGRYGNIIFSADEDNVVAGSLMAFKVDNSEAMRIDSFGNVLVGKTVANSATVGAEIRSNGRVLGIVDGGNSAYFNRTTSDGEIVRLAKDGTTVGSIGVSGRLTIDGASDGVGLYFGGSALLPRESGAITDATVGLGGSTQRFTDLYLSGGVYLGGTGAANKLDDYEEGTWTPTASFYSGSMTVVSAEYTKIGHVVLIKARLTFDGTSDSDNVQIAGLPFSMSSTKRGGGFIIVDGSGSINSFSYATATSLYARNTAAALQTYNAIGANTIEFWFMYEAS